MILIRKWLFVLQPGQECKLENKMRLDVEPRENENIHPPPKLEGKPGSAACYRRSFFIQKADCDAVSLKSNYPKTFPSVQPVVKVTSPRGPLSVRLLNENYTGDALTKRTDAKLYV